MPYFKNDEINILFIHIPKTGGTSVNRYLSNKYSIPLTNQSLFIPMKKNDLLPRPYNNKSLQHQPLKIIKKYKDILRVNFNNITIFATVRNPYERIVSDLFHFSLINRHSNGNQVCNVIKRYIRADIFDNHNLPQHKFIEDEDGNIDDKIIIMKNESLGEDMIKNGYTDFNRKDNLNKTGKINHMDYLNKESIKIINEYYNKDFELFGYEKVKLI